MVIYLCQKINRPCFRDAGFDAVKFQKRNVNKVYTQEFLDHLEKVRGAIHSEIKN